MSRPQPIVTKIGRKPGEYVVDIPAAWELRLRRVLRQLLSETLPDPREAGISPAQREARVQLRRKRLQAEICKFISDVVAADLVGKEVAISTRNRYGSRRGSLREHVAAILKDARKP